MKFLDSPYSPTPEFFRREVRLWNMLYPTGGHYPAIYRACEPVDLGEFALPWDGNGEKFFVFNADSGKDDLHTENEELKRRRFHVGEIARKTLEKISLRLPQIDFGNAAVSVMVHADNVAAGQQHRRVRRMRRARGAGLCVRRPRGAGPY